MDEWMRKRRLGVLAGELLPVVRGDRRGVRAARVVLYGAGEERLRDERHGTRAARGAGGDRGDDIRVDTERDIHISRVLRVRAVDVVEEFLPGVHRVVRDARQEDGELGEAFRSMVSAVTVLEDFGGVFSGAITREREVRSER